MDSPAVESLNEERPAGETSSLKLDGCVYLLDTFIEVHVQVAAHAARKIIPHKTILLRYSEFYMYIVHM